MQRVSEAGEITSVFVWDNAAYQRWDFFPESSLREIGERAILRGVPVSRLRIFPFQWNPATQELRYFNHLRLHVQFENPLLQPAAQAEAEILRKGEVSPLWKRGIDGDLTSVAGVYERLLQSTIINYSPEQLSPLVNRQGFENIDDFAFSSVRQNVREPVEEKPLIRHVKQSDALRIEIREAGIYRLSYEDLVEAGLQPQLMNPKRLHLFNRGEEVAIQVISEESDKFQPGDYIEFYAVGFENVFTDTNVYWLYWRKKGFGKRMAQIDSEAIFDGEKINAFYEHLHIEQGSKFWLETPGAPEQDYQFWGRLNASDVKEYTLQVPAPFSEPTEAVIRVGFQGRSTAPPHPNHHTLIQLNGTKIGDEFWDGDSPHIQEMRVSSELFIDGKNTLTIEMPGDTGAVVDVIYLNWIEVEYWRNFEAVKDSLVFTVNGNGKIQITVNKLTQPEIRIYDITNPFDVAEVINFSVESEKRDYQATFETPAMGEKTFYVSSTQQSPPSITPFQPANLKAPKNGADYILITDKDFLDAVQPLGEIRRRQGLRVKVVSTKDIYNEFNDGLFNPAAIKDFLQYAYQNWGSPAPTYVFLVGDASIKYRDSKSKKTNKVPTHLSASYDGLIPDDNWYVSVDGDDILPDMFIGRIPGSSPETVAALIDKIIRFEESTVENPRKVLLVADSNSDFEDLNEGIVDYLPGEFDTDKVYLRSYFKGADKDKRDEQIAQATFDIISSFNDGVMLSNYIGHGVVDRWSGSKGLFKQENVHTLSNEEQLAFALMLT
jgi:hypothetical protein